MKAVKAALTGLLFMAGNYTGIDAFLPQSFQWKTFDCSGGDKAEPLTGSGR